MKTSVARATVDLSGHPDLIVIYLGMRVHALRGLAALFGIGPNLRAIERDKPDGLLAHESVWFGLRHIGFRQYWCDLESLESFTRSAPHRDWWREFLKRDAGAGFWHETYRLKGGMEAIYLNMPPIGFAAFAPEASPTGGRATARDRLSHAN